jgi:RHO1 GDP-GTP exchange protein 1/2
MSSAELCLVDAGRRVVYGTDDGVYISDMMDCGREPLKVLALMDITQIDVLEEYQLLIVLSGTCHPSIVYHPN